MRSVVVFPAPLGPSRPRIWPASHVRSTPSTTRRPPSCFTRPRASSKSDIDLELYDRDRTTAIEGDAAPQTVARRGEFRRLALRELGAQSRSAARRGERRALPGGVRPCQMYLPAPSRSEPRWTQ